jgi:hypothetical protein
MAAASSSGTNQQLTLDSPSFEKLLAAAWVLQCLHDQLHPQVNSSKIIVQAVAPLGEKQTAISAQREMVKPTILPSAVVIGARSQPRAISTRSVDDETRTERIKAQEAIETGILNLDVTVKRLLSPKLSRGGVIRQPAAKLEVPPIPLAPLELEPTPPAEPRAEVAHAEPSFVRHESLDSKKVVPAVSSNFKSRLNRLYGAFTLRAIRVSRALIIPTRANIRTNIIRLDEAVARYRADFRLRTDKNPAWRLSSFNFQSRLSRLYGAFILQAVQVVRAISIPTQTHIQSNIIRFRDVAARYRADFRLRRDKKPASQGWSRNLGATFNRLLGVWTQRASTIRVNFSLRSLRAIAIATPVWLLAVVASLLLLPTWWHQPFQGARASVSSPAAAVAAATASAPVSVHSDRPSSHHAERIESTEPRQAAPIPNFAVSHEQITDPTTSAVVAQLSRYEINGLRRRAKYGDDSAAFTLGMAYEVGRYLRQNCTEASRWVTAAAQAGNPAAQYNLGLRYRDGDGVSASRVESEKWLRKAAHRNRQAKVALQLLASR